MSPTLQYGTCSSNGRCLFTSLEVRISPSRDLFGLTVKPQIDAKPSSVPGFGIDSMSLNAVKFGSPNVEKLFYIHTQAGMCLSSRSELFAADGRRPNSRNGSTAGPSMTANLSGFLLCTVKYSA